MQRREFVGLTATAAAAGTAGCLGVLTGSKAVEREAKRATVESSALSGTGYELARSSEETVTRTFDTPVGKREAKAVNKISEYHRAVTLGTKTVEAAVFAVLSTPAFEFGGETFNPVGEMSNRELAKLVQGQYSGLSVGSEVDSRTIATLGGDLDYSKFEGSGTVEGKQVPVYLHVGKVRDGADFVLPLAVYPQQFQGEADRVAKLVRGLSH